MRNSTKKNLICALALGVAGAGLIGYSGIAANADVEDPFKNFAIAETAEIRTSDPVGIRFTTGVDDAVKAEVGEDAVFGTLVIPKALLDAEAELTLSTDKVANVVANKWLDDEKTSYAAAIVGQTDSNGNFTDLPEEFYDDVFYARGYVTYGGETVYTTNHCERSIAYVASALLASGETGETAELYASIVDYVNPTLAWDATIADGVELEIGSSDNTVSLSESSDTKGLVVKYSSSDEDIVKYADGKLIAVGAGTATITAEIGSEKANLDVKVNARTYNYGELTDLSYGNDFFYYSTNKWGASALASLGTNMATDKGNETVDYGKTVALSDAEYNALLAAGYKGSLTKKSVWRADRNIMTTCTVTGGKHNGYQTAIFVGSSTLNYDLIEKMMDTNNATKGAYISVWVRSGSNVNMRYSNIVPVSTADGTYSGKHLSVSPNFTISKSGTVTAGTWVEMTVSVDALRAPLSDPSKAKGLGFAFYVNTNTAQGDEERGDTVANFDVYSVELCYPDVDTLTGTADVSLPDFGYDVTENLEVYNASTKLTQGTDYTYANGKLSGLAVGTYALKQTVSSAVFGQRTITRNYTYSNQVAKINTTDINYWGWSANYQNVKTTTLSAQPKGYDGMRTDLTAVTGNSSDHTLRMGIDISALTPDIETKMKDDQYLSVWVKFEWKLTGSEAIAPKVSASGVQLSPQRPGDGSPTNVTLNSHFITTEQVNNGEWMNLCFMKDQLNVTNVANMKYLYIYVYDYCDTSDPKTSVIATVYSVELMTLKNVVDLKPAFFYSAAWHNTYQVATEYAKDQKLVELDAAPAGYNGTKTDTTALYMKSTKATELFFAFNVSYLTKNIDTLMDDNDYVSIWIKYSTKASNWYGGSMSLKDLPSATACTSAYTKKVKEISGSKDTWQEIRITKADMMSENISKVKWLNVYTTSSNENGGGQEVWIYDIALVNVD